MDYLLRNGTLSYAAMAVGYVEGARTLEGGFTPAFFGQDGRVGSFRSVGEAGWAHATAVDLDVLQMRARINGRLRSKVKAATTLPGDKTFAALNVIDLWVQSPAAALGWSDDISVGMGYVPSPHPVKSRIDAYKNIDGQIESTMTPDQLRRDQLRRARMLTEWLEHWLPLTPQLEWSKNKW